MKEEFDCKKLRCARRHPTSNIHCLDARRFYWMLDVGCWMLDVPRFLTYPFARNQSTASAKACSGGVCGRPSSRTALPGSNHILCRAMRTPDIGARGGLPVKKARYSLTSATRTANQ